MRRLLLIRTFTVPQIFAGSRNNSPTAAKAISHNLNYHLCR
jgi:hypothetical protein